MKRRNQKSREEAQVKRARRRRRQPTLTVAAEQLERRTMMSATARLLPNGTLLVRGTPGNDSINILQDGPNVAVSSVGMRKQFPANAIRLIHADLLTGSDSLTVSNLNTPNANLHTWTSGGASERVTVSNSAFARIAINSQPTHGTHVSISNTTAAALTFAAGNVPANDSLSLTGSRFDRTIAILGRGNDAISATRSHLGAVNLLLGDGTDSVRTDQSSSIESGLIHLGAGINETIAIDNTRLGVIKLNAVASWHTTAAFANLPSSRNIAAYFGPGNDRVTIANSSINVSNVYMGSGNDNLSATRLTGTIGRSFMGAGNDTAHLASSRLVTAYIHAGTGTSDSVSIAGSSFNSAVVNAVTSSLASISITDTVVSRQLTTFGSAAGVTQVVVDGGTNINTLHAPFGAGNDTLRINSGRVNHAVIRMGAGDDTLTLLPGVVVAGTADGGSGQNTLDNRSNTANFSSEARWSNARITATLAPDGTLTVRGTEKGEKIRILSSGEHILAYGNDALIAGGRLLASRVRAVDIESFGGNDHIQIDAVDLNSIKIDVGSGSYDAVFFVGTKVRDVDVKAVYSTRAVVSFSGEAINQVFVEYGQNADRNSFDSKFNSRIGTLKLRMSRNRDTLQISKNSYIGTADVRMGAGDDILSTQPFATVGRGEIRGDGGANRITGALGWLRGGRTISGF